ncbi:MAG TPA: hypothetical protein DCW94_07535 [Porticoccaceae bacterium]|jgi:hypothetical protein|nr:hypothetical protein [Porticoccaceae bacterium]
MYSAENYLWGWIAYGTGVTCLLFVLWYWMRNLRFTTIRHLVLLFSTVFLLTPVTAYRDDPHLAPAFFVSLYEGLLATGDNLGFQRGLAPILAFCFLAVIFYVLARFLISRFTKGSKRFVPAAPTVNKAKPPIKPEAAVKAEAPSKAEAPVKAKATMKAKAPPKAKAKPRAVPPKK